MCIFRLSIRPVIHYNLLCYIKSLQFSLLTIPSYSLFILDKTYATFVHNSIFSGVTYHVGNVSIYIYIYISHFLIQIGEWHPFFYNSDLWTWLLWYYNFTSTTLLVFYYECNSRNHTWHVTHFNIFITSMLLINDQKLYQHYMLNQKQ